jgi:hypothetical protein
VCGCGWVCVGVCDVACSRDSIVIVARSLPHGHTYSLHAQPLSRACRHSGALSMTLLLILAMSITLLLLLAPLTLTRMHTRASLMHTRPPLSNVPMLSMQYIIQTHTLSLYLSFSFSLAGHLDACTVTIRVLLLLVAKSMVLLGG